MSGESPWMWMFTGALVAGLGGFLFGLNEEQGDVPRLIVIGGIVMMVLGGILIQVAVIAAGVAMGMARHETLRARRR